MQYEFRSKTLAGAVRNSLAPQRKRYERKSSISIDSDVANYSWETLSAYVERGRSYTISWSADVAANDGGDYGIKIRSRDGHGSYRETFSRGGNWGFVAKTTGEIEFDVGISRSFGARWSSYPVEVDID